jgi:ribosomal-protein-alanine N-acetyltransferase
VASARPEYSLYHLRSATHDDLDAIVSIEAASFPVPWRREFFAGELRDSNRYHRVLDRQVGGSPRIAGYLFAVTLFDEFHINKIATHPAVRGEGHGTRLMNDAIAAGRSQLASSIVLEVRLSNALAIRFYSGFGFIEIGRRRRYYKDGEDAMVMMLPLLDLAVRSR